MGGRGAASGVTTNTTAGNGRPMKSYDVTHKYAGMNLHQFENAIRNEKYEIAGAFDKNGTLLSASTSYNQGSTALPLVDYKDVDTLTHNHPANGNRYIGGTFSEADITNSTSLKIREVRAVVGSGHNEHTYIFRENPKAKRRQRANMSRKAQKIANSGQMQDEMRKGLKKAQSGGKKLSPARQSQASIGAAKNIWKQTASKYGYEYVEVKKAHW